MNIIDLPSELFVLIVAYLSPADLILNRRVSKHFNAAFTDPDLNYQLLLQHYPRARELRLENASTSNQDWAHVFQRVAARYHCLESGTPRAVQRLALTKSLLLPEWAKFYPVAPWQRHLLYRQEVVPFQYPDTLWTYDEGLLIFPSTELQQYALYNLETGIMVGINIGPKNKIVRRIRLKEKVLVVEWCEPNAYHQLNESETVYRHFASAYDVVQDQSSAAWALAFRNEWKIHFLGLPLNSRDRFFSNHSVSYYVMYLWQPNRSAWGEDEPIEALVVWDISSPSSYRPSEDPTGNHKPDSKLEGSKVIRRLSFSDLSFYDIRQRATPSLRDLDLDETHVYIIEENHERIAGNQASFVVPEDHEVRSTGIPFASGPRWVSSCAMPGGSCLSYGQRRSFISQPNLAPCWRHDRYPSLTIAEMNDAGAKVTFKACHYLMLKTITININIGPKVRDDEDYEGILNHKFWGQSLLAKGKICGDERWLIGENAEQEVVILYFDGNVVPPVVVAETHQTLRIGD